VLDGAGDADGDVQSRRNDLARLPDLKLCGGETRIASDTGRPNSGIKLIRQGTEDFEKLVFERASA
jgi:hypothetical protein